jgi:transposase
VRTIGAQRPDATEVEAIVGVDTHLDFHVAVAVDHLGREAWTRPACRRPPRVTRGSCAGLRVSAPSEMRRGRRHKQLRCLMLARHLRAKGVEVLEVERPKHRRRSSRQNIEKSDSSDAEAAARAVLAGESSGVPKSGDGEVEMIRALLAAPRSKPGPKGCQPAAGHAREGAGATAPPFAWALDERARLGGRALPRRGGPRDVASATK